MSSKQRRKLRVTALPAMSKLQALPSPPHIPPNTRAAALDFQLPSFRARSRSLVHCRAPRKICLQCKNMWRNYVFLSHPIKRYSKHNAPETQLIVGFITLFRAMETIQDHERKESWRSCGNLGLLSSAVLSWLLVVTVQLDSILLDPWQIIAD